ADQAQGVVGPNCGGLLETAGNRLEWLQTLKPPPVAPLIPLGSTGAFEGATYTVLGFVERSVTSEGERYPWHEYLLYEPRAGFRWLVESSGHWSFVRPLAPGELTAAREARVVSLHGKTFRRFQGGLTVVDHVLGEFYWRVEVGET